MRDPELPGDGAAFQTRETIEVDDSAFSQLLPEFPHASKFISAALSGGGGVLVHCMAGVSRSTTVATAYLMKAQKNQDAAAVLAAVRSVRAEVKPNAGFMHQLRSWGAMEFNLRGDSPAHLAYVVESRSGRGGPRANTPQGSWDDGERAI